MRTQVAFAVVLAACSGGGTAQPAAPVGNAAAPAPEAKIPAPIYAGLFVDGASYRDRVEWSLERYDRNATDADANGMVRRSGTVETTCTVGEAADYGDMVSATLTCDSGELDRIPVASASPGGFYLATPAGLWRARPADDLDPADMILAARPEPRSLKHEDPEGGYRNTIDVARRADGAWCWHGLLDGADVDDATRCFADGLLVDGGVHALGRTTYDVRYTLIR